MAQGSYRTRVLNNPSAAVEAYREAEKRLPNSALVYEYMAYAERRLSRWRDAEAHLRKATELDPRNTRIWTRLATDILEPIGRAAEAETALDRALEIAPSDEFALALKAEHYQEEGQLDKAAKELAHIPEDSTDKTFRFTASIRRCSNATMTRQSSGHKRQPARRLRAKRSTLRTSLLSRCRVTASTGPAEMTKHASPLTVLSRN